MESNPTEADTGSAKLQGLNGCAIPFLKGHELSYAPGVVEYIQEKGYSEHFGARPMLNVAMRVLGDPVAEQMLINGGWPVRGIIKHDGRSKKCSLEVAA